MDLFILSDQPNRKFAESNIIGVNELAVYGGAPVRASPMPGRRLFDKAELDAVENLFDESWESDVDFGYQGKEEDQYCQDFSHFQGGGYSDAVATGTATILVALMALELPKASDIIVSPITDPGSIAPIILLGHQVVVADSCPHSFNVGAEQFERAITPNTRAAVLTHTAGIPIDIEPLKKIADAHGIHLIEDCSQAHGALYHGEKVGTFGALGCFSTMFSKLHASGGCGGLVFTKSEKLYWRVRAAADRGKNFEAADFNPKDAARSLFPALNLNLDELSCAIGRSTLRKVETAISSRLEIVTRINEGLVGLNAVHVIEYPVDVRPSPFFHTIGLNINSSHVSKIEFAKAVAAEGIGINPDYRFLVADWPWLREYCPVKNDTPNARRFRDTTFNILFHEKYSDDDVEDLISAIQKVDRILGIKQV